MCTFNSNYCHLKILLKINLTIILIVINNELVKCKEQSYNEHKIVDEGDKISLNCEHKSIKSTHPYHHSPLISWIKNEKPIVPGGKYLFTNRNSSLTIKDVIIDDEGIYICQIPLNSTSSSLTSRVANNHIHHHRIKLSIREKLKLYTGPSNRKLELGSNSKIHCKIRGNTVVDIKWIKDSLINDKLPSHLRIENGTLYFDGVKADDHGKYICIVKSNHETVNMTVQVDIVVLPKFILTPKSEEVVIEGHNITLNCQAIGDPKPMINWDQNGSLIMYDDHFIHEINGSLTIVDAQLDDSGIYGCIAGNSGGLKRLETKLVVYDYNMTLQNLDHHQTMTTSMDEKQMKETLLFTLGAAGLYMIFVLLLMICCRCQRARKKKKSLTLQQQTQTLNQQTSSVANGLNHEDDVELRNTDLSGSTALTLLEQKRLLLNSNSNGSTYNCQLIGSLDIIKQKILDEECSSSQCSNRSKHSKSSLKNLQYPRKNLQTMMLLGHGEFGDVYLAKMIKTNENEESDTETIVMVKSLHSKDDNVIVEFKREMDMFHKLNHSRIAKLIGICCETEPCLLLMEYTDWGDLKQFLLATRKENSRRGIKPNPLNLSEILSIIYKICNGMDYLTANRFIHKDLATRNCLITSSLEVKISSSSLSKDTYSTEYIIYRNRYVPVRWCPCEAVFESEWSAKSDIWSFGVLIWEILHQAELPYSNLTDDQVMKSLKENTLKLNIIGKEHLPQQLINILNQCWSLDARQRCEFYQILPVLESLKSK